MNAFFPQLLEFLRGVWHGRWAGLAVAWIAGVAGAGYLFLTPDRYQATARVYVDTQSILKPLMRDLTVQPNVEQEVAILSRTLISRPNLQKLIRMTDMDLNVSSVEERERLMDYLTRILYIRAVGHGNLYTIGFSDRDPAQATRVVQSLLSIFVESGLSGKSNDTGNAKRFIEEQIKTHEQRLTEAENLVKEFKLRNLDLSGPGDFFGELSTLSEQVRDARLLLQEAHTSRDALKLQMSDEEDRSAPLLTLSEEVSAVATPELDARLTPLKKNLDDMLLRYTDGHPDVVNTRRIIHELEAQREEERKRLGQELEKRRGAAPTQASVGANAAYPQLKLALAESEAQVARMQTRVADLDKRYAQQRDRARSVPEREAEFAQLNRDYSIQKKNYDTLVSRREAALMSGEMEAATGVADFRIIDPPSVSPTPVFPDRRRLVPLVLLAALCAGIFASYAFSVARPVFHDNRGLKSAVKRPVLGAVSLIASSAVLGKRRRSRLMFLGGVGGLAATYSAAIAVVFMRGTLPF